jgi:hypothetical protein
MWKWFLLFFLVYSNSLWAADLKSIAQEQEWRRLLYYKHHWFTGKRSSLDGDDFFLSKSPRDPYAELLATLEAFETGRQGIGKKKQPAICAFPLRKEFLERRLGQTFPSFPCKEKDEFLQKLNAKRAYLVFATAYNGNPASMFGHSFLKIESGEKSSLLDWSINYAAMVPEDENPFAFAYFGLTGGYMGQFTLVPYYLKVEEYGLSEGRDLWEYELNFTPQEIERLLAAIWEIETNSHYDYYFFDENCSLQLLTLLEVVRADWNISDYFLHMIPGESVKKVAKVPGAIKDVRMRPSLERRLRNSVELLSAEEKLQLRRGMQGDLENASGQVLAALAFYFQAEKKREGEKWQREGLYRSVLAKIANQPVANSLEPDGKNTRPDISHGAYAVQLGPIYEKNNQERWGGELGIRFAYHQLFDSDAGYLPHSEVLFPHFTFQWKEHSLRLKQAEAFSLVSLQPWSLVKKPISWRTRGGYRQFHDERRGVFVEAGLGSAWRLGTSTVWGFVGGEGRWTKSVVGIPWLELGWIHTFGNEAKLSLQWRNGWRREWYSQVLGAGSWPISQDLSLRLESSYERQAYWQWEQKLLAVHYF